MAEIFTIKLDMYQATAVAGLVLLLGMWLRNLIPTFKQFCIPAPVIGGLVYAILHCIVRSLGLFTIDADMTLKNVFMIAFFCTVGYSASFKVLAKAGKSTVTVLILAIILVCFQDAIGTGLAYVFSKMGFNFDPILGLCVGSVPLVGGHGTSGSFGPVFESTYGVTAASTVAIAAATYGLVSGNLLGGPIANARIKQFNLKPTDTGSTKASAGNESTKIDGAKTLTALLFIIIAVGLGQYVFAKWSSGFKINIGQALDSASGQMVDKFITVTFPNYLGAMIIGAIIRNVCDMTNKEVPMEEVDNIGNLCLQTFLGLAMMDLKLWQLVDLAVPMIVILVVQTVFMGFFAYFVAFNVLGKNYDAAVMTSGICGFGMGATPNAVVNMQTVTEKYGPSKLAFLAVPVVGSMFIDFFNAFIISGFATFIDNVLR